MNECQQLIVLLEKRRNSYPEPLWDEVEYMADAKTGLSRRHEMILL
jgi:hypothetical protein